MKILELFSGYGTASFALKRLGIDYHCVGYSDIDKYANQCFKQNHMNKKPNGQITFIKELGDVKNINPDDLEDFDLLTGGFPCQTFSIAGKGKGELDTRGTLFNEIIRIAEVKKPRYIMLENVKGLMNIKHRQTFNKIIEELYRIGYWVKWQILNTKDYEIPQNRQRIFFCCFKYWNDYYNFKFPQEQELKIFLKDILEEEVDEKYYLSEKMIDCIITPAKEKWQSGKMEINLDIARPLTSTMHKMHRADTDNYVTDDIKVVGILNTEKWLKRFESARRVYSTNRICPTIPTSQGGGITPKILINPRVRRLTPKECFRLQGFLNDEVNLEGLSNTQQYKLAGNGQSVNVVEKIFRNMFLHLNLDEKRSGE